MKLKLVVLVFAGGWIALSGIGVARGEGLTYGEPVELKGKSIATDVVVLTT